MEMVNDSDSNSNDDNNNNSNDNINNNSNDNINNIIMVVVLSDLQFNFHHKVPLEGLSKWLKP